MSLRGGKVNILIGLLLGVVFSIVVGGIFYTGYKLGNKKQPTHNVDDEQIRKSEQIHKDFQAVFNYDVPLAMQRKKVT